MKIVIIIIFFYIEICGLGGLALILTDQTLISIDPILCFCVKLNIIFMPFPMSCNFFPKLPQLKKKHSSVKIPTRLH